MNSVLVRVFAFFAKEFHDIRRQPLLLLSLVGGPLLVLGAFGATFRSENPFITAALVWPENGVPGLDQAQAEKWIGGAFHLSKVTTDRAEAMAMLDGGLVDVVQIVPDVTAVPLGSQARPEIEVFTRTVDPTVEAWVRSLVIGEMNYINRQLLAQEARSAQGKASETAARLESAEAEFRQLQQSLDPQEIEKAGNTARELRAGLVSLLAYLPPPSDAQANLSPELSRLQKETSILVDELDELEQVLRSGDLAARVERLSSSVEEIATLRAAVGDFVAIPPENIVSPIRESYTNLRGTPYSMVVFYTPAVLALLVQQLGITLGALGLVRERQMGSYEMFRVSPLRFSQLLIGKALAYVLYVVVAGVILTLFLVVLKVPLPAYPLQHLALLILLATASVGIGFLISSASQTDSQAIQLTMLALLLSIFFTGFFLPLTGFSWPAWVVGALLPMTHAIDGFQSLLLKGTAMEPALMTLLAVIALLAYGLVLLVMRRQYRKTTG